MKNWQRGMWAFALIVLAVATRWLPHSPNFTPVLAIALLAGGRFSNRWLALGAVLGAMAVSDLILGFHSTLILVYVSLALITVMGAGLKPARFSWLRLGGLAGASSVLFFVVTNFGVWSRATLPGFPFSPPY